MKNSCFKLMVAASAVAMAGLVACGDDSSSPSGTTVLPNVSENAESSSSVTDVVVSECSKAIVTAEAWLLKAEQNYLIYSDGNVTNADGVNVGYFDFDAGLFMDLNGAPIAQGVDVNALEKCSANAIIDQGTGEVTILSSSSAAVEPALSSAVVTDPTSSAIINPVSSSDVVNPLSSALAESSSSVEAISAGSDFPDISTYPVASYKDISGNGTTGWNTRYWDACKPHCSWIDNGSNGRTDTTTQESYVAGLTTARNCNVHDVEVPTFTLGSAVQKYWYGFEGTNNSCQKGATGTFACTDMAPIAVNDTLSYAYVAGPTNSVCGKCYHLQYDGSFKDVSANNAPKETHKALKGKHIIVMSSNIGTDVKDGQFDLMVPGGGVGIFDALSIQVNGTNIEWGEQYGGFLTYCQKSMGYDKGLTDYQTCVKNMCDAAFGNAGFPNLLRGCHWFADWYMAADNPTYQWEEVECPQYLMDHYLTRINTEKSNNYKWQDDWSSYTAGAPLDTLLCWKAGEDPLDPSNPNAGCDVQ